MTLSIFTQNEEIVNYGEVIAISPVAGIIESPNGGEPVDSFGIVATVSEGDEIQLGIYESEEAVMSVMAEIKSWLSKGVSNMFEMPADTAPESSNFLR